jgi:2'-5' RNA ligase
MSEKFRAFIAIALPPRVIEAIGALQSDLKDSKLKIRWVKPANIHLTLKFLGDIPAEMIPAIEQALGDAVAGHGPLRLSTKGIGVFPGIKKPRVVWVGVSGQTRQLRELHHSVESSLQGIGFAVEKRSFKSHLTMGRIKGFVDSQRLLDAMQRCSQFESETFDVHGIHLYRSQLKPSGAVYTRLVDAALGAGQHQERSV